MIKEYKLRENKPHITAVTLERNFASIGEVLTFAYGESYVFDPNAFPDNDGIMISTLGGQEKLLYGDTLIKDENGNLIIQWTSIFNELYEEVENG